MKSKSIRNRFRSRSRSAGRQSRSASKTSENIVDPPAEFHDKIKVETIPLPLPPVPGEDMKTKKGSKLGQHRKSSSDDYGFLSVGSNNRQPTITISPQTSKFEVDYFDESLFDIGYLQPTSERDSIPITLGSISSKTGSQAGSIHESNWSDMPLNVIPKRQSTEEPRYMNTSTPKTDSANFYGERMEGHYARLSEINVKVGHIARFAKHPNPNELNFYVQKAAEQRARSRSRGPEAGRGRSRSTKRSSSQKGDQARSRSRGCSASRDIMALYTNRPVSRCRLRDRSSSPERDSISHLRRRQSVSPDALLSNIKTRQTNSPQTANFEQGNNNNNNQKSLIKNKRQIPQTLSQWVVSSTPRSKTPTANRTFNDGSSRMTLLEMDSKKNAQIEETLEAANSLRPAGIKMMMIAPHSPANEWEGKDEVSVKAGEIVTGMYKQNDWLFIETEKRITGFVPYAYTKPVKVTSNPLVRPSSLTPQEMKASPSTPTHSKPVTGILKNSTKPKSRKSLPKYSVKVRTAADNDSLSSESSSALTEDFVYTRKKYNTTPSHADCIVIDNDGICSKFEPPQNGEETGTYCSDSGISDPMSNHSEDIDLLHSPMSIPDEQQDSGVNLTGSTPRLPKERIVSVTRECLASSPALVTRNNTKSPSTDSARNRFNNKTTISDMPLGPLGARLAKIELEKNEAMKNNIPSEKKLSSDMRERARCSSTTPSLLRPEIPKDYGGPRVTVVYDYDGDNEDDLRVQASDIVTVLNGEDIEWIWVQRRDGKEGFIPREYVIQLELSAQNRRRVGISLL